MKTEIREVLMATACLGLAMLASSAYAEELAIRCHMSAEERREAERSVGPQYLPALIGQSCLLGEPVGWDLFRTGNGWDEFKILRGYRVRNGRVTHALVSVVERDLETGEYRVLAENASPMDYDIATGALRMPDSKPCPTPFFKDVQASAVFELSNLTGTDLTEADIPVCDLATTQSGLQVAIFRGFLKNSTGKIGSALMSEIWFDPRRGAIVDASGSASGPDF